MPLQYSFIYVNDTSCNVMSNNKLKKRVLPQKVFALRDALMRDFFRVYECSLDELEILELGDWEPDYPATPSQMAKVLLMCNAVWHGYISKYSLPKSLKRTLETKIKQEWQLREDTAHPIPKRHRTEK